MAFGRRRPHDHGGSSACAPPPYRRPAWGAPRHGWGVRPPPRCGKEGVDLGPVGDGVAIHARQEAGCGVRHVWVAF
jgi:hypothetical protein